MSVGHRYEKSDTPDGSGLTWIFDHCLRYADCYEISLRAAYELNSQPVHNAMGGSTMPRTSSLFSARNSVWSKNSRNSKASCSSDASSHDTNAEFRACLTRTVSELPSQPCTLPPSFIISFVRRCFCLDLAYVDFAQALTALDYIRDLQNRWKKETQAAFNRLNVGPADVRDPESSELARDYPNVLEWYKELSSKARTIDFIYTQIYVGLRRWVLVNEMMLEPFNKANCLALLNTLFPPIHPGSTAPTQQCSIAALQAHRDTFFSLITNFEADPSILEPIMAQGARPGEENGWPALHEAIERYMTAVLETIDECTLVTEPCQIGSSGVQRRIDSGISFTSRPSGPSFEEAEKEDEKPLPHFPELRQSASKYGSFLDRFALSGWNKKKDLAKEQGKQNKKEQSKQEKELARSLKKMQSCKELSSTKASARFNKKFSFELTDEKRARMIHEAKSRKASIDSGVAEPVIGQAI
ncbi:uncharacterized protein N7515_006612 [Penicillium bovifimosum]|uniref:Uncharacterized protein n=1 Tax=Penicillium bovifimosum TaxID=126998 RepID=A0A9W9GV95_9EURO|nr:uncharacterized protein N7515_006612 [Penicillium bovifimosum]KAJ5130573.1 hypothetical protein N7515_006612 [Penicillium bovifimosum]